MAKCSAKTRSGSPCQAPASDGKRFCLFHDPAAKARATEAGRKGGKATAERLKAPTGTLPPDTPPLKLRTVEDVIALLEETANNVRAGKISTNVGNALGQISGYLLKALEGGEVERRLAALEQRGKPR